MARKELGLDSMGIQKTMRFGDYMADAGGQFTLNAISGLVGVEQQKHGWVEIPMDGKLLIFDTTLENSYLAEDPSWNMKFFALSYDDIPWPYTK